jgi:hypothetical protein
MTDKLSENPDSTHDRATVSITDGLSAAWKGSSWPERTYNQKSEIDDWEPGAQSAGFWRICFSSAESASTYFSSLYL